MFKCRAKISVKRTIPAVTLTLDNFKDKCFEEEIKKFCEEIEERQKPFSYIEWTKERCNDKSSSYFAQKMLSQVLTKNLHRSSRMILMNCQTMQVAIVYS